MKSRSLRISTLIFSVLLFGSFSSSYAWQTKYQDKKMGGADSVFKVDGVLWAQYEFLERNTAGLPDTGENSNGFGIGRTYINVRGSVKSGKYKGWGFRITPDMIKGKDGTSRNSYMMFLKAAYVDIPLARGGKTKLRLGQQGAPNHTGGAGHNPQKYHGHRYFDDDGRQPTADLGYMSAYVRGLSLIHKGGMWGAVVQISNGEGLHNYNAVGATTNPTLNGVGQGASSSYGYNLSSYLHFKPTGKNKKFVVSIGFPMQFNNRFNVQDEELSTFNAEFGLDGKVTGYKYIQGSKRSLQDRSYGVEVAVKSKSKAMTVTLVVGTMRKIDRRGGAWMVDKGVLEGTTTVDETNLSSYYYLDTDHKGKATYVVAHAKFGQFGVFASRSISTGRGAFEKRRAGTVAQRSWMDSYMYQYLNSGGAAPNIFKVDDTKATQTRTILGVTWHAHKRFKATLGLTRTVNTDKFGAPLKTNKLAGLNSVAGGNTIENDLDAYARTTLGGAGTNPTLKDVTVNDIGGTLREYKQMWIRTQYKY